MELLIPFANTGDKQDFDEATAPDGSMSLEKGFTTLFELKPEEGGLFILRREFNQLMYLMSKANVEFNTQSFPNWIADAGSETPYAYNTYAIVRYTDGNNYISLVDNNTEEPTIGSNWQEFTTYLQSFGIEIASTAEAQAGTDNTKAITPLGLREGLNASGTAPIYACRAWVNFNGTGTTAIRGSGNVSSLVDDGTGLYTASFIVSMPDANYSAPTSVNLDGTSGSSNDGELTPYEYNVAYVRVASWNGGASSRQDCEVGNISIFI